MNNKPQDEDTSKKRCSDCIYENGSDKCGDCHRVSNWKPKPQPNGTGKKPVNKDEELRGILEEFEKDLSECYIICEEKQFNFDNEKGDIYLEIIQKIKALMEREG